MLSCAIGLYFTILYIYGQAFFFCCCFFFPPFMYLFLLKRINTMAGTPRRKWLAYKKYIYAANSNSVGPSVHMCSHQAAQLGAVACVCNLQARANCTVARQLALVHVPLFAAFRQLIWPKCLCVQTSSSSVGALNGCCLLGGVR